MYEYYPAIILEIIGISRQSLIGLESQDYKIMRPVWISKISYYSLRHTTVKMLYESGLYDSEFDYFWDLSNS